MKKIHYIFCLLISVILISATGCRPKGILSSKQMEDIFVDLHTTDAMLQQIGYNFGHDEEVRAYYLAVLEEHGTTQAQFDSSLVWYTANPTIFDKIYPKVIERLQAQYDAYQIWDESVSQTFSKPIDKWINECLYGWEWQHWQKKCEKNAQKFVYIKKIL